MAIDEFSMLWTNAYNLAAQMPADDDLAYAVLGYLKLAIDLRKSARTQDAQCCSESNTSPSASDSSNGRLRESPS